MPTSVRSQGVRVTTGYVDTVQDDFPGGGANSPGFAPGQLGTKATLASDAGDISLSTNRYEGTVQYVQTLSTDTTAPQLGYLAFWSDRANYIVTTAGATAGVENFAGIFLGYIQPGKYGFIKIREGGGRTLVNFSGAAPAAGSQAVATTGPAATVVASATDIKSYHIGTCLGAKTVGECAVVGLHGGES